MDELETRKRVKGLYELIIERKFGDNSESLERRVEIIKELERLMNTDFKDTADFNFKCQKFIKEGDAASGGKSLRKARKKMGWKQNQLADALDCTRELVSMMESDKKQLSDKATYFLELTSFPVFDKGLIIKQLREGQI